MAVTVTYGVHTGRYATDAKYTLGQLMTLMAKGRKLGPKSDLRPIVLHVARWDLEHEEPLYLVHRRHADFAHVYHVRLTP